VVKSVQALWNSAGFGDSQARNPLWRLAGPNKIPEFEVVQVIRGHQAGRPYNPVHSAARLWKCSFLFQHLAKEELENWAASLNR
jgi:hypothetical protein